MTRPARPTKTEEDLADVLELIRVLKLPAERADDLNPYVREKYLDLWRPQNQDPEI